jgi:hypothetical protein
MSQAPVLSGRARSIVAALAVTQTVGYGCLYYSFAVFLAPIAADLGDDRTAVTGAFTIAVLTAAALAVPVGRWLDRHGARGLMKVGSVAGTLLLVALAHVHSLIALYLGWAGIGAVGATVFYEAAFATVIAWTPALRRNTALLAVTLVAGFASSIFLPDRPARRPVRLADGGPAAGRPARRCHRSAARSRAAPSTPPHPTRDPAGSTPRACPRGPGRQRSAGGSPAPARRSHRHRTCGSGCSASPSPPSPRRSPR